MRPRSAFAGPFCIGVRPIVDICVVTDANRYFKMPCYSPLKGFKDAETGGIRFKRDSRSAETMEVGCGVCLGCRLDWSLMWAMRCVHEGKLHERDRGNSFITLTYRDRIECTEEQLLRQQHVADDWSLNKRHFQLFMKRLRRKLDCKIRYFAVGEYGYKCKHGIQVAEVGCPLCRVGRPHYHAILFNCSFDDLVAYKNSYEDTPRFTSPCLEKTWGYGFVDVGPLNHKSAAYCARYSLKKVGGAKADDHYLTYDMNGEVTWLQPEFALMSRGRPCEKHSLIDLDCDDCEGGIGAKWFRKYWRDCYPHDEVPVAGMGIKKGIPRFYEEMFKEWYPEMLEEVKEKRRKERSKNRADNTPRRLEDKFHVKKRAIESLKRREV